MTDHRRLLAVDPDGRLAGRLTDLGAVESVDRHGAADAVASGGVDCVVCSDAGDVVGTVAAVRERDPDVPIVVVAADGSERLATDVLGAGATDYVPADDRDAVRERVARASRPPDAGAVADGAGTDGESITTAVTDEGTPVPLASVASSLSEVLVTIDTDSVVRYVNGAVTDVFGYDPEAVVGEPLTTLMPERFHDRHHEGVARYLATGEAALDWSSVEIPGKHADGHEIDLEVSFGEFTLDGQRYFTGLIRDVSPIAAREQALSDLYEASRELLLATTPEAIAETTVETAAAALDLPITGVFRYDPAAEALVSVASTPAARERFGDPSLPAGESLAWQTFQAGETRVIDAVHERPDVFNPGTEIRTELQVPIGDRYLLLSGATDEREFADYQIDFAELLATSAEAALGRAERAAELRRYETIFRTIDDRVCVVDADGYFRLVNEALCSFLGVEAATLTGMSAAAFLPGGEIERVQAALGSLPAGESRSLEVDLLDDAGERHPCEIDVTALPPDAGTDGYVVAIHDISDRRAVESALAQQRDRFQELFENVPDPVVEARIDDGRPIVQSVNEAFEATFGYDAERVVGESLNEFVLPPEGDDTAHDLDRRAEAGELVRAELKRETADGIRYFLFRGIPVATDEAGTLAFGIYTDITDQRLRERRLGVLNRVFRHNIRNDMSVVRGRAEHLLETDDPDVDEHARTIRRTADGVVDLAEGIRTAERALEREDAPRRPLDDVLTETVAPYRSRSDVVVRTRLPAGSLPRIDARIGVAVEELIDNALSHSDREHPTVEVAAERTDGVLSVTVSDDGPGLPAGERAVVESREETPLEHGTGVGLWLVTWLVTALGGEIDVADNDPRGTVVRMTFPASAL